MAKTVGSRHGVCEACRQPRKTDDTLRPKRRESDLRGQAASRQTATAACDHAGVNACGHPDMRIVLRSEVR